MGRYTSGGVGRDILAGAVAGVAAIWVADKLDQAIYRSGGRDSIRKTEAARPGGMDPAHVLAKRAADAAGVDIGDPKDNPAGHTIHYGIAAGMGALYGLLRGMSPGVSTGRGTLFGIAMFILQDEIGNTVLGTAGNPMNYPIRDHARGAASHTLFGIVTDLGTRLIAPWRDDVVIEHGPPLSERLDRGRDYLIEDATTCTSKGGKRWTRDASTLIRASAMRASLPSRPALACRRWTPPTLPAAAAAMRGRWRKPCVRRCPTTTTRLTLHEPVASARAALPGMFARNCPTSIRPNSPRRVASRPAVSRMTRARTWSRCLRPVSRAR